MLFLPGNSCFGIAGIPNEDGEYEATLSSTLFVSNEIGEVFEIELSNNDNDSQLSIFSPTLILEVQIPVYGCTDSLALNYDSLANFEDGTCLFPNLGCTDPLSLNYDDSATMDDGSCDYCAEGIEYVAQIQMNIINSCEEGYVLDCDGSGNAIRNHGLAMDMLIVRINNMVPIYRVMILMEEIVVKRIQMVSNGVVTII